MPRLITSNRILRSSVSFVPRQFGRKRSKAKEIRVHVYFTTASTPGALAPVSVVHSLGYPPSAWDIVHVERDPATGPPGTVFTVFPWASSTKTMFCCSTAATWAEIVLR